MLIDQLSKTEVAAVAGPYASRLSRGIPLPRRMLLSGKVETLQSLGLRWRCW